MIKAIDTKGGYPVGVPMSSTRNGVAGFFIGGWAFMFIGYFVWSIGAKIWGWDPEISLVYDKHGNALNADAWESANAADQHQFVSVMVALFLIYVALALVILVSWKPLRQWRLRRRSRAQAQPFPAYFRRHHQEMSGAERTIIPPSSPQID